MIFFFFLFVFSTLTDIYLFLNLFSRFATYFAKLKSARTCDCKDLCSKAYALCYF